MYAKRGALVSLSLCGKRLSLVNASLSLMHTIVHTCLCDASSRPVLRLEPLTRGRNSMMTISRQGLLEHDIVLGGALVHMYAKCGALRQAQSVLEKLPSRDVVC